MAAISPQMLGILIGGIGSAILLGFFAVLMKASGMHGLTSMPFLIVVGATVLVVGLLGMFINSNFGSDVSAAISAGSNTQDLSGGRGNLLVSIPWHGVMFGIGAGLAWSIAMLLVKVALDHYGTPISILTPIINTNTLIAVALGLWLFAEWQFVKLPPLLIGTTLIVVGGVLVSGANLS